METSSAGLNGTTDDVLHIEPDNISATSPDSATPSKSPDLNRPISMRTESNYSFTKERFNNFGEHLTQWDYDQFEATIISHVDHSLKTRWGKAQLLLSTLMYLSGATLNIWFLTSEFMRLKRDTSEDYNLTNHFVSYTELTSISLLWIAVVYYVCRAVKAKRKGMSTNQSQRSSSKAGFYLNEAIYYFIIVSSFSILIGIVVLDRTEFWNSCNHFFNRSKRLWKQRSLHQFFKVLYHLFRILLGIIAPVVLLLKMRQVDFVVESHVSDWETSEYFQFLGFLNNFIGITSIRTAYFAVDNLEEVLFTNQNMREEEMENHQDGVRLEKQNRTGDEYEYTEKVKKDKNDKDEWYTKRFMYLVASCVWKKYGFWVTVLTINSWKLSPQMIKTLMRGSRPGDATPSKKNSDVEQRMSENMATQL